MKAIEINDELNEQLLDKSRHISDKQMHDVCLIAQSERTCKYIAIIGKNGFACAKGTSMGDIFDDLAKNNKMIAKSDNCEGLGQNANKEKEKDTKKNTED